MNTESPTLPKQTYHWHSNKPASPLLSQVETFVKVEVDRKWHGYPCGLCEYIEQRAYDEDVVRYDRTKDSNTENAGSERS